MYKLSLSNKAHKELKSINNRDYLKTSDKISNLENEPKPIGCIKLQDQNAYRIRVGNYRILYEVNEEEKIVFVYQVAHRKDVYR